VVSTAINISADQNRRTKLDVKQIVTRYKIFSVVSEHSVISSTFPATEPEFTETAVADVPIDLGLERSISKQLSRLVFTYSGCE